MLEREKTRKKGNYLNQGWARNARNAKRVSKTRKTGEKGIQIAIIFFYDQNSINIVMRSNVERVYVI